MIASKEADGKEESNQFEVPLMISNGSMLLERSKSKSDGNIGEESKFGPSNEVHFAGMKSRSVSGSIDCDVHQGDVVSRRKKTSDNDPDKTVEQPEAMNSNCAGIKNAATVIVEVISMCCTSEIKALQFSEGSKNICIARLMQSGHISDRTDTQRT